MGWEDTLKGWANDAADFVEDTIDDAGDWIQDTVDDIAGKDSWASNLVEKAGDIIDGEEGLAARAWDALDDYTDGTALGTAFDAVDGFAENGLTGAAGAVKTLIGDVVEDTWVEDVYETAEGIVAGGAGGAIAAAQGLLGGAVKDTPVENVAEAAEAVVAGGNAGEAAAGVAQNVTGDVAEFTFSGSSLSEAAERGIGAGLNIDTEDGVADDTVLRAAVEPDIGQALSYDDVQIMTAAAPAAVGEPVDIGVASPAPVVEIAEPITSFESPISEAAPVVAEVQPIEEPVVDIEPAADATGFELSLAAADQVQDSVDDMFADLA